MMDRFLDPGFRYQSVAARTTGLIALRLAQADILPLTYSKYAREVLTYLRQTATRGVDVTDATKAAQDWLTATERLESRRATLLAHNAHPFFDTVNRSLLSQERALTQRVGLPDRPWFRHQVYAPGLYTGYAVRTLPGVNEPLDKNDTATATRYLSLLTDSLTTATRAAH